MTLSAKISGCGSVISEIIFYHLVTISGCPGVAWHILNIANEQQVLICRVGVAKKVALDFRLPNCTLHTFYPVTMSVFSLFHKNYLSVLVTWLAHFSSVSVLNICCILCLNIAFIHSSHTILCGHTTLNGLITKSAQARLNSPLLN